MAGTMETGSREILAVIIPVFNEEEGLRKNFLEIHQTLRGDGIACRYFFVDDGSTDQTWFIIKGLAAEFKEVSAARLARNFGKELALCAGISGIDADCYLTMDSDLQHPPRYVKEMLGLMKRTGANIVEGVKSDRGKEPFPYRLVVKSYYRLLKVVSGLQLDNSTDFKIMDRKVIEALRTFPERDLFFRGIVHWTGFHREPFFFEVEEREKGSSKLTHGKRSLLALNAILSYTGKPLYGTILSGALFLVIAVILGLQTLHNYFSGHALSGFSTVILLLLIIGSLTLLSLGIIGVYISRIYDEIKARPRYFISEWTD